MKKRIWELDCLRGVLLLLMIFVHLAYDLIYLFGVWEAGNSPIFEFLRDWAGMPFIVLSGLCATLGKHPVKTGRRGVFGRYGLHCGDLGHVPAGLFRKRHRDLFWRTALLGELYAFVAAAAKAPGAGNGGGRRGYGCGRSVFDPKCQCALSLADALGRSAQRFFYVGLFPLASQFGVLSHRRRFGALVL